jgi:hypothetical protein
MPLSRETRESERPPILTPSEIHGHVPDRSQQLTSAIERALVARDPRQRDTAFADGSLDHQEFQGQLPRQNRRSEVIMRAAGNDPVIAA